MKIIFLDIDGVLCTNRSHAAYFHSTDPMRALDPVACRMIYRTCIDYGVKIVVSSSWGHVFGAKAIREILVQAGFPYDVFYKDAMVTERVMRGLTGNSDRTEEIFNWLNKYGKEVERFCVVDDAYIGDDVANMENGLVIQTNVYNGLMYDDYLAIRAFFKNRDEE